MCIFQGGQKPVGCDKVYTLVHLEMQIRAKQCCLSELQQPMFDQNMFYFKLEFQFVILITEAWMEICLYGALRFSK